MVKIPDCIPKLHFWTVWGCLMCSHGISSVAGISRLLLSAIIAWWNTGGCYRVPWVRWPRVVFFFFLRWMKAGLTIQILVIFFNIIGFLTVMFSQNFMCDVKLHPWKIWGISSKIFRLVKVCNSHVFDMDWSKMMGIAQAISMGHMMIIRLPEVTWLMFFWDLFDGDLNHG